MQFSKLIYRPRNIKNEFKLGFLIDFKSKKKTELNFLNFFCVWEFLMNDYESLNKKSYSEMAIVIDKSQRILCYKF